MTVSAARTPSMRFSFLHKCHRLRLIALMAFMLLGVQLLQHSPLHDHVREVVDCALCHLQTLGDDTEYEQGFNLPMVAATTFVVADSVAAPGLSLSSPYQGRAPPARIA